MRFRLRTLLIVLAIGPMLLAGLWFCWRAWQISHAERTHEFYEFVLEPAGK